MIFYEEFLKNLENSTFEIKEKEKFCVEAIKLISVLGIGLALLAIGVYQSYIAFMDNRNIIRGAFGMILIFLAFKQLRVLMMYRLSIDTKNKILKSNKILIDLNDIKTCTLKQQKIGKHLQTVVAMVNNNNEQFIIPFYMGKKLRFAYILKSLLKDKFIIKK